MKILRREYLLRAGAFAKGPCWKERLDEITRAVESVVWPKGAKTFTLYPESGKKRGKGNGVGPIKDACMASLKCAGWSLETKTGLPGAKRPGPVDAAYNVEGKLLCLEWETGNISSSHRALNKMCVGMLAGKFIGGVLILPTRCMYKYLTDRVGNYEEIEPYFDVWKNLKLYEGVLMVIAIEHDALSKDVPRIGKATDGRALQ